MPKIATELTQGQVFTRTAQEGGLNDTAQRVYKVILLHPAEVFDPQAYTGTYIGSRHPFNLNLVCTSFDAKFDGDSRMVSIVTFNYQTYASWAASAGRDDPKTMAPNIRPANWSTDVSLVEVPAPTWVEVNTTTGAKTGDWQVPINPAGDRYEGVSKLVPSVTIRIDQYEPQDPLRHAAWVGTINDKNVTIGSLTCLPHTLMFRGVSSKAHVETFRNQIFRGWLASYEFSYRDNWTKVSDTVECHPGWDRLQVVEGFNVKNVAGCLANANVDPYGMALKHANYEVVVPLELSPDGIGKKTRAMVGIPSLDGKGGMFQRPASSPIALNDDGTARKIDSNQPGALKPIVIRYQVQQAIDFAILNLRLF